MEILGLDIGGTGIKGAIVDTDTGNLITERYRQLTPQPSTPDNIAMAIKEIVKKLNYTNDIIGMGFPTLIRHGIAQYATNIDNSWIGVDIGKKLEQLTGYKYYVANDADTAGLAEAVFGSKTIEKGLVIFLTIGTGIGSALIFDGKLIPNSELGKIQFNNMEAEKYASNKTRKAKDMSWKTFGKRLNAYLKYLDMLFSPQMFILGGGVCKKMDKYQEYIKIDVPVVQSEFLNAAGVIGAAYFAAEEIKSKQLNTEK